MSKLIIRNLIIVLFVILLLFLLCKVWKVQDKVLKFMYPKTYSEYVEPYAKEYKVKENLIFAVIKAESNFKEEAVSNKGAKGLMQLMDNTAEDNAKKLGISLKEENVLNPEVNIKIGTKYLSDLLGKYGCIEVALTAYNAGSGNVDKWIEEGKIKKDGSDIENVPYKETNNYVRKILRDYKIYEKLYGS